MAIILEFGQSSQAVELGYSNLTETFDGTRYQAESEYEEEDVILVQGASYQDDSDVFEFAVFKKPSSSAGKPASIELPSQCQSCSRILNNDADLLSIDCGGDCIQCMAESGDADCVAKLASLVGSSYALLTQSEIFEEAYHVRMTYSANGYFDLTKCMELNTIATSFVDLWNPKVSDATFLDVGSSNVTIKLEQGLGPLRRNLTIAQALGFYFLQYVRPKKHGFDIKHLTVNKFSTGVYFQQAHIFACALLMPADLFEAAYNKHEGNELAMSDIFNVPTSAIKQMFELINLRTGGAIEK